MIPGDACRSYEDWRRLWLSGGDSQGVGALRFHGLHDALALAGRGDASVKPRRPTRASRAVAEPVIGDAALDEAARQVRQPASGRHRHSPREEEGCMLIPEVTTRKIEAHHLAREACLYTRQSSVRQVMENTESARCQYGLRRRAMALGWSAESVRVIDEDQGKSAASSANRTGFRDLMARIAAGEVGIVLGLEVSRLARDNAE